MRKVIVIAGGGTGGHIYPGIAIARAIQKQEPATEIHFVGSLSGLEQKIIPKEGFPLHLIAGGKLNFSGNRLNKIKTLLRLPIGFAQSVLLILRLKPAIVLGVGGYASGPFVLAAALLGRSTAIWEPNAHPGMANRWLSRFVQKCFVVFVESKSFLSCKNIEVIGMPVRAEIEKQDGFRIPHSEFHILHYGGSQGARVIGRTLCEAIKKGGSWLREVRIVHQSGSLDHSDFLQKYQGFEGQVELQEFIYDMPKYYRWADLVICRSGASTLTELAAFGLPAIVIPLPLADGHQEQNAMSLVQGGAAVLIPQQELTADRLVAEIERLRSQPDLLESLANNIKKFYKPQAADRLAAVLLGSQ